jgi:hypothetical protein
MSVDFMYRRHQLVFIYMAHPADGAGRAIDLNYVLGLWLYLGWF